MPKHFLRALRAPEGRKKRGSPHHPGGLEGRRPATSIFAAGAGRAHRSFRSLANIGVLRADRAQPLYLLTPAGHFALRATAHWARASFRRTFGSLCRLWRQVSRLLNHSRFPNGRAHGFAAPLRVALGLRPKCPQGTRFPSRHRAHASLRCRAGGEFAPPAQTFLKHLSEKAGAAGLFRQAERPRRFVSPYTSRPGEWPGTPASPDATARRNSPAPSRSA